MPSKTVTHYTPAVAELVLPSFPPLSSAGERLILAEGSPPLYDMGLLDKEKSESCRGRSNLALVRQKIVHELCNYAEAVK